MWTIVEWGILYQFSDIQTDLKKKTNSSLWSDFILSMKKALFYIWNSIAMRNHLKTASFTLFMIQSVKPLHAK